MKQPLASFFWIAIGDVVNSKLHAVTDQIHAAFIAP